MTVAIAAPAAPCPSPKIKTGSKIILPMEPRIEPAIACVAAMGLFWAGLVWLRTRQLGLRDRLDSLRLQAED